MDATAAARLGRTDDVDGLAVYEMNRGATRSVVCVHGGLDRATSFSRLARRLPDTHLVAYDRRGYQGSRPLGPGTLLDHATDLAHVVAERAPGAVVLGHSFGGLVALVAGVLNPGQFTGIVCYESPVPWLVPRPHSSAPDPSDPAGEAERFFQRVVSKEAWQRLRPDERESRHLDGPALVSDLLILGDSRPPVDLATLRIPALYAFGDGPAERYYERLATELEATGANVRHRHVPGVGHGIHLSHPQMLADLLRGYLDPQVTVV